MYAKSRPEERMYLVPSIFRVGKSVSGYLAIVEALHVVVVEW